MLSIARGCIRAFAVRGPRDRSASLGVSFPTQFGPSGETRKAFFIFTAERGEHSFDGPRAGGGLPSRE